MSAPTHERRWEVSWSPNDRLNAIVLGGLFFTLNSLIWVGGIAYVHGGKDVIGLLLQVASTIVGILGGWLARDVKQIPPPAHSPVVGGDATNVTVMDTPDGGSTTTVDTPDTSQTDSAIPVVPPKSG